MFRHLCSLVVVALLLASFGVAVAQGDPFPNRYVAPAAGFTVYYPIGWTAEANESIVTLSSGVIWMQVYRIDPAALGIAPGDGVALVEHAFNPVDQTVAVDPAGVISQASADGGQVFVYHYDDTNANGPYSGAVAAVEAPDGTYFLADLYPRQGTTVALEDLTLALQMINALEILPGDEPDVPDEPMTDEPLTGAPDIEFFQTGIGVDLPPDWLDLIDENNFLSLESDATVFEPRWYFPDEVAELGLEAGDVPGVLAEIARRLEMEFDAAAVETSVIRGRTISTLDYNLEDSAGTYEALLAGVALDDGTILTAWIFPTVSDTLDERAAALGILASARQVSGAPAPPDALLSESYAFDEGGVTFYYPAEWRLNDDESFIYLASEVTFADPYYTLAADLPGQGVVVGDLAGGLEALFAALYETQTFDPSRIERRFVEGRTVLLYTFEHAIEGSSPHIHWLTASELEDGTQVYLDAYPRSGSELLEPELVLRVTAVADIALETMTAPEVAPAVLEGDLLITERCTVCHTRVRIDQRDKDEAGWTATVDRMIGYGARLDAAERGAVIAYLVATH